MMGAEGSFTNNGTLNKSGAGMSTVQLNFTNTGGGSLLEIDQGQLNFTKALTQNGGTTYLNGGDLQIVGAGFTISGGIVKGSGTITATLVTNNGAIDQTGLGGYNTLTIQGDYTQGANGQLRLKIARGTMDLLYDRLVVTGQATLNGFLTVEAQAGYTAQVGDNAELMTYQNRVGDFPQANQTLPAGMTTNPQATQYFVRR